MERWSGRVAVVTGASSGIGAAIAAELTKKGLKVVGLARRVERVEELSKSLQSETGKLYAIKCDVTKNSDTETAFKWVKDNLGGVDILVNNAGVGLQSPLIDGSPDDLKKMMDLNVLGLSVCTQQALKSMRERGVDDGHIIHINSVVGHITPVQPYGMYCATKHAVTALTEGLRQELVKQKSKIRVTSLSPGLVETEMPPEEYLKKSPSLKSEDIAAGVLYVLGAPPHVQELSKSLQSETGKLYAIKCDVTKNSDTETASKWVKDNLGGVDILVNNAGVGLRSPLIDGSPDDLKKMMDLNVLGLSVCTQQALKCMKEGGVDDGHIIHINSVAGHVNPIQPYGMYCATKHAVTALTEGLRQELVKQKSKIRVTSLSPGLVETEMPSEEFLKMSPALKSEDIAAGVLYVLGAPPHVQVHELTIIPVGQTM